MESNGCTRVGTEVRLLYGARCSVLACPFCLLRFFTEVNKKAANVCEKKRGVTENCANLYQLRHRWHWKNGVEGFNSGAAHGR